MLGQIDKIDISILRRTVTFGVTISKILRMIAMLELVSIVTVHSQLMAIMLRYKVFGSVLTIVLVRNVFGQNIT